MNKRMYGMAPGGRMALDKAANRRRNIWHVQRQTRARERRDEKDTAAALARKGENNGTA